MAFNLSDWLHASYLESATVKKLWQQFQHNLPFPYLELPHFFLPEKIVEVLKALAQEEFTLKEADLFKFRQTADLISSKHTVMRNSPLKANFCDTKGHARTLSVLQEFRNFLCSEEFVSYLSTLTNTSLKPGEIDMSATIYEDTDFLLCHDDQLESRKIAYFLYLSDVDTSDGGWLNLFSSEDGRPTEAGKMILPKFNTFSFFLVSEKSFHSVEEVVSDTQRIAISGWFRGKGSDD